MKLHEYQSKLIFAEYGIPIPKGSVAATASEAKQIAEELGGRVVVKSQVLVGGRGKAGGIRLAKSPKEAEEIATQILSMEIKGLPVRKVLIDEAAHIESEIYLGITNDRAARKPVIMASSEGGCGYRRSCPHHAGEDHQGAYRSTLGLTRLPGPRPGSRDRSVPGTLESLWENCPRFMEGVRDAVTPTWPRSTRWSLPKMAALWQWMARWSSTIMPSSDSPLWLRNATWISKPVQRPRPANMAFPLSS